MTVANCGARFSGPALCPRSVDGKHKCCRVERHETKTWLPPEEAAEHACRCGYRQGDP